MSSRVLPRLGDLIAQHLQEAFIIVAHAGVNRVILSEALGLSLDHLFRLDQNYGCLNVIDYFPDMAVVRLVKRRRQRRGARDNFSPLPAGKAVR